MKALEEEAKEAEKAENAITKSLEEQVRSEEPKGYVSVKMERGARSYNYGYTL